MSKTKISGYQAFMLLFLCRMFDVITYSPMYFIHKESMVQIIASAISLIATAIMLIPIMIFYNKIKDQGLDIIDVLLKQNRIIGYIFFGVYFFTVAFSISLSIIQFKDFMINAIGTFSSGFILVSIFAATLYATHLGLEGLARAGSIIFVIAVISIGVVLGLCFGDTSTNNLLPIVNSDTKTIVQTVFGTFSRNVELVGLILLFPKIKGNFVKVSYMYVLIAGLVSLSIWTVMIMLLGDFIFTQVYPFLKISSIINLGDTIQRLDSVQITVWVAVAFFKISFYMILLKSLFKKVLPLKYKNKVTWIVGGVVTVLLVAVNREQVYKYYMYLPYLTIVPILVCVIVFPVIAIIIKAKTDKKLK